jgi:hypothetical protein
MSTIVNYKVWRLEIVKICYRSPTMLATIT